MRVTGSTLKAIYVKKAKTTAEVARLRHEAAVLSWLSHPGSVTVVGQDFHADRGELHLVLVEGLTFENTEFSLARLVSCMTTIADTLAHMHSLNVVHTRLTGGHVLIGMVDRLPVICGFGDARTVDPGAVEMADDVAALGRLLESKLKTITDRSHERLTPAAAKLADEQRATLDLLIEMSTADDPRKRPTARTFAHILRTIGAEGVEAPETKALPSAAGAPEHTPQHLAKTKPRPDKKMKSKAPTPLPSTFYGPATGGVPRHKRRRSYAIPSGIAAALLVLGGFWAIRAFSEDETKPVVAGAVQCPEINSADVAIDIDNNGCPDAIDFGPGKVTVNDQQFVIGESGDQLLVGNWTCTGTQTLALLRPSNGNAYVFDNWPTPGNEAPARLVGTVEDATRADVKDDGAGCDLLSVTDSRGNTTDLDPKELSNS